MQFDSVTIKVTDGIKQGDYAPNKSYDLTGILTNASDPDITAGILVLLKAGEAYLGRVPTAVTTTRKPAEKPAPQPAPPAEKPAVIDPLEGAATPASAPTTATEAGSQPTGVDTSDPLTGAAPPADVKPITDDEIVHAVMTKNAELKDATKIRALVETYNPQPGLRVFKATEIEQADRAGFLVKLTALTA